MLELNKLYNMDCVEGMAHFPDKYFDLAIVDPPYGINADSKNSIHKMQSKNSKSLSKKYGNQVWDKNTPNRVYFMELIRVSRNQIIWGANYYGLVGGMIYWHKNVTMPTYSDGELAYCSLINSVRFFEYTWHGMLQADMKNKEYRIHPTQKPVALYKWLLKNYAKPGDKILDTHGGSCSSVIACIDGGFDWIAFELDKDYYKSALDRINKHIKQTDLFNDKKQNYTQTEIFLL